jgi:hypothetical protein
VDIKTSEVDAKLTPVNVRAWKFKFHNHGNKRFPMFSITSLLWFYFWKANDLILNVEYGPKETMEGK